MTSTNKGYEEVIAGRDHYVAVGINSVFLDHGVDYPWHLVTSMEPGGVHRLNIRTYVWFIAQIDPRFALRWYFEVEPYSANGKGMYEIDIDGCRNILAKLPLPVAAEFKRYLNECATAVEAKAQEIIVAWEKQASDASDLREITKG